jgi:hypothetical protein
VFSTFSSFHRFPKSWWYLIIFLDHIFPSIIRSYCGWLRNPAPVGRWCTSH